MDGPNPQAPSRDCTSRLDFLRNQVIAVANKLASTCWFASHLPERIFLNRKSLCDGSNMETLVETWGHNRVQTWLMCLVSSGTLWQDVILPFVCDTRFPEDTLWIIMEEDMEFCPPDIDLAAALKVSCESNSASSHSALREGESFASESHSRSSSSGATRQWDEPSASRAKDTYYNELVGDIVKLCNQAWRDGVGDLVWLGHNPPEKDHVKLTRSPTIKSGTQCVALCRRAATALLAVLRSEGCKPDNIDDTLRHFCIHNQGPDFGCCWVWPPVGSFKTHLSECHPSIGMRYGGWSDPLRCPFVRPAYDPNDDDRHLYRFVPKGHAEHIRALSNQFFESDTLGLWRSFMGDATVAFAWSKTRSSRKRRRVLGSMEFRHWVGTEQEVGRKTMTHRNQTLGGG